MKDVLREVVQSLERKHGLVRPSDLLEVAQNPESPIHDLFEWDDTEAAKKFRQIQAGKLIVSVKIETPEGRKQEFYQVQVNPFSAYASVAHMQSDEELHQRAVKNALNEIDHWNRKYQELSELEGIVDLERVEEVKEEIK